MIWWPTEIPTLRHGLITLRPAEKRDIPDIFQACQDPLIPRFTTVTAPYTMSHAESFVGERDPQNLRLKTELRFVVTRGHGEDEEFCGVISLHSIDLSDHCCEIGYWMAASARGQGIGTIAAKMITDYGIQTMGFRRIEALVDVDNLASQALLRSAGYEREGVMKQKVTRDNGQQIDMALYAKVNL